MKNEIKYINIEHIQLDLENPRLPYKQDGYTHDTIINYMLHHGSILSLMQSIAINGFFAGEPLVVLKINDEEYIAVEGNRRLSSLYLLNNPHSATIKQKTVELLSEEAEAEGHNIIDVPCVVFHSRKQTSRFLGFKHIVGVKNWSALEKARYIYELRESTINQNQSLNAQSKDLAKMIGSKSDYIKRFLIGYEIYLRIEKSDFYNIKGLDETSFTFVNLSDSLNRSNLPTFLGIDLDSDLPLENLKEENVEVWTHWLFDKYNGRNTALKGTSAQLSILDEIVTNAQAVENFKKYKDLHKAKLLVENINDLVLEYLDYSKEYLDEVFMILKNPDSNIQISVEDKTEKIKELCKNILSLPKE
jgi:hypothetical protein